jgi:cytosine deaminase
LISHPQWVLRSNAKERVDIAIKGGKIVKIAPRSMAKPKLNWMRAAPRSPKLRNTHLHLCKVYTLMMMDEAALKDYHGADMGKAMTAIELAAKIKEKYDEKWIIKNVRKAAALAGRYGCTHIRAFADVDSKAKLEGVKALIKAREEFKGIVDIQVVAFAQDGLVREPGAEDLLRQA